MINFKEHYPSDKWKVFSLSLFLCEWEGDSVELFDKLAAADYRTSEALFDEYQVTVWEPMDAISIDSLTELIVTTASEAQHVENEVTV